MSTFATAHRFLGSVLPDSENAWVWLAATGLFGDMTGPEIIYLPSDREFEKTGKIDKWMKALEQMSPYSSKQFHAAYDTIMECGAKNSFDIESWEQWQAVISKLDSAQITYQSMHNLVLQMVNTDPSALPGWNHGLPLSQINLCWKAANQFYGSLWEEKKKRRNQ